MFFHRKDSSLGKLMDPAVVVKLVPGLSNLQPYWMLLARTTLCYPGHRIVHNFSYIPCNTGLFRPKLHFRYNSSQ
jgi:hypothetical protein